ncbi:MAG: prephenate dehydratase [Planctomycetota bacterium]|nr:prephenate dehydratase [Planctomycetota bacterium]
MTDHLDQPIDGGEPAPPSPRRVSGDGNVPPVAPTPEQEAEFARWRDQIDALDQQLVLAMNQRAKVVQQVGEAKRRLGYPVFAPHREREVLEKIKGLNQGPLASRTLHAIWRQMMSGSFALERGLRIAYLGPRGSFSHLAATRQFGESVEHVDVRSIGNVFSEVATSHCDYGMVPYENSSGGSISDTLDAFLEHDITVYAEVKVEIRHSLYAQGEPDGIRQVMSKPQVFDQCRRWLRTHLPQAELVPELSTSRAVERAASEPGVAAIGSEIAGDIYGVPAVFRGIQDSSNNITRFLVIGREAARPTGDDKTTVMFVTKDRPGALVDVLADFQSSGLNLSHIDKRPSGRENWEYTFFVDVLAHRDAEAMQLAIEKAREHCVSLRVVGSYPRAQNVL